MRIGAVFVLLCFALFPYIAAEIITGETIATGEVISSEVGMTISVLGPPSLVILSPENETYLTGSLLLNYSVSGEDVVWYSLNGETNITLTSSVVIDAEDGLNSLFLYANNSYGNSSKVIFFNVNESILIILHGEYDGLEKGDSTNFLDISYEDLQSLEDIIFEKTSYGKISFDEVINITDDLNNSDNVIDIDTYINISLNTISIDSVALPNFNKPATLSFYNLSFSDPRVLVNDEVCPSFLCNVINYSGGTLEVEVDHFTTYSVEETPEDVVVPVSGGGGSGGGGGNVAKEVFLVDTDQINVEVKQGRIVTKKIVITNKENRQISVNIRADSFVDTIVFSSLSFALGPLESKEISIDFIAREDRVVDIYIGKIIVESEDFEKDILFSIIVESETELFDIGVYIPEDYIEVIAGKDLLLEVELFNFGETGRIDAEIKYFIKNSEGKIIVFEEEVKAVETSLNFLKSFNIPADLSSGKYIIYVQVSYGDQVIGSSAWFSVLEDDSEESPLVLVSSENVNNILAVVVVVTIIVIIVIKRLNAGKKN